MQELQKTVLKQREQYKSHLALGAMPATPKISDGQYTFKLGYEPINLGCREGDIDIIQESLPDKQSVLLTLDTEDEKPVLTRTLTIEELKKAFEAQIKIPAASPGKVYRLTLCTDTNKVGDCRRATPAAMDFAARKKNANKNQHHIFYAQTFMTDTNGLQIFDSRRQDLEQKDVDAMQIAGKKKESSYLKQLAAINATVKPLPAVFQDNTFKMKLTFRDMKACEGLGGGK